jgi:Domain of unknown function (DUF4352)
MYQPPDTDTQPTPVVSPPMPPPKKRMRRTEKIALGLIGSLVLVVVVAVAIIFATAGASQVVNPPIADQNTIATANANNVADANAAASATASENLTATANTAFEATASAQITSTPQNDIGSSKQSGPWSITVNSVKPTVSDNQFEVPKPGNQFVLINFTALNTESAAHDMNPYYFTLRDDQGNSYDLTALTVASSAEGTVVGGQKLRGDLAYELPKTLHSLVLQFDSPYDVDRSQIVQWNLSL